MTRGPSRDVPAKEHEPAEARADHGRMTTSSSAARRRVRCRDRTRTPKPVAEEAEAGLAVALSDDATIEVATDLRERSTHSTGAVSEGPRDPGPIFDRGAMEAPRRPTARIVAHPDGDGGLNRVKATHRPPSPCSAADGEDVGAAEVRLGRTSRRTRLLTLRA